MTEDEKKELVHNWMRTLDSRITVIENLLLELLRKMQAAGLIVDADDDNASEE